MKNRLHILLVEDNAAHTDLIQRAFSATAETYRLQTVATLTSATNLLQQASPDLIIADNRLPDGKGTDLIIPDRRMPRYPVVVMTSYGDEKTAVDAIKRGAIDYVVKSDHAFREMPQTAHRALREWQHLVEKVRAEEELVESEHRYRKFAEILPQGVFATDLEGNVTYLNRAGQAVFGFSEADVTAGINVFDYIDKAHQAYAQKRMTLVLSGHPGQLTEYVLIRKDGTSFTGMVQTSAVHAKGELIGLEGILIDITERKAREEQLIQSQRMEALGVMAGGIAHDFNNILSAVMGYADISLTKLDEGSLLHGYLTKIRQAGKRAADIVQQILLFSRNERPELHPVQMKLIVKEAFKLLRSSIPSYIDMELEIGSEAYVLADPTQIHQIVMNLCTNAMHAIPSSGGTIKVTLSERTANPQTETDDPTSSQPALYAQLAVEDTGSGIPPEIIPRIFEPYFTTKDRGKGTGLGLSVVHGIVNNYDGHLKVTSEVGRGTSVIIQLPTANRSAVSADEQPMTYPTGDETILFVDDEDYLVEIGQTILEKLGYRVVGMTDPVGVIDVFRDDPARFDLVITDMTMPRLTGNRLAANLLEIDPRVPIIICTGQLEPFDHIQLALPQIKAILKKPVNIGELSHIVRETLDNAASP